MKRLRALALTAAPHTRLLLFAAVLMSLFAYAGRPLLIAAAAAGAPPALAWSSLFVLAMLPMLAWFGRGRPAAHWIGYATLALFSLLFTLVFLGDVVRLSFRIAGAMLDTRLAAYTILGTAGALSLVGLLQARCPRIRRVAIPIDELPQELDGYRIVQWSDVHVGPTIRRRFLQALVERTNELHPDAIAITGDFVDGSCEEFHSELEPLAAAQARDGIFYVTGNHEYYWHVTDWLTEFERYGLRFLKNSHEVITRGNAKLVMAGVTDPVGRYTHKQDPDAALAGTPSNAIKVLLSHRPQTATAADRLGVHLQLSGHTHGGQFFPFNLVIKWFQPIVAGLHRVGKTWLYVNRGTGYWGPPTRLFVGGEITVIELRRS
jgi:predicted MPP superfamily phosphohydrolase